MRNYELPKKKRELWLDRLTITSQNLHYFPTLLGNSFIVSSNSFVDYKPHISHSINKTISLLFLQEMDRVLADNRRQSYSTGRCLSSPLSCLIHTEETEYARISNHNNKTRPSPKLRDLMRRLLLVRSCGLENNKSKTLVTFHYDAVSYSQNFDDGFYLRDADDDPKLFRDFPKQSPDHWSMLCFFNFIFVCTPKFCVLQMFPIVYFYLFKYIPQ